MKKQEKNMKNRFKIQKNIKKKKNYVRTRCGLMAESTASGRYCVWVPRLVFGFFGGRDVFLGDEVVDGLFFHRGENGSFFKKIMKMIYQMK